MDVAVLGTGVMGAPMARNLAKAGVGDVRVWNLSPEKAEPLAHDGCTVAGSVAEAVDGAGAVLVMLADGDAVLAVLDQALPAMGEDAVLLQTSTVGLDATEAIVVRTQERGVTFVDAPVLGTRRPAEQGGLIVLASGPDDAVEGLGPVFDAVAAKVVCLGEAGRRLAPEAGPQQLDRGLDGVAGRDARVRRVAGHRAVAVPRRGGAGRARGEGHGGDLPGLGRPLKKPATPDVGPSCSSGAP